jgi:ketosteroid isomerase-like protein
MSQDSVEIVRRLFNQASRDDSGARGRLDALDPDAREVLFESLAPEIEFHEDPRFPEAGTHRGIDAVRDYLNRFAESFDELSFEAQEFVDLGDDRVLVLLSLITRGRGSGARVEASPGWIVTARDGLVVRVDAFLDRPEALEAAGVSE